MKINAFTYLKRSQLKLVLFVLLCSCFNPYSAQVENWEFCGQDDNAHLSEVEAAYLNEVFEERKGDFNFKGKKVAFFSGSSGLTRRGKSDYFNRLQYPHSDPNRTVHEWMASGTQLLILTPDEREQTNAYDAILVFWSKLPKTEGKPRKRLVRRLK